MTAGKDPAVPHDPEAPGDDRPRMAQSTLRALQAGRGRGPRPSIEPEPVESDPVTDGQALALDLTKTAHAPVEVNTAAVDPVDTATGHEPIFDTTDEPPPPPAYPRPARSGRTAMTPLTIIVAVVAVAALAFAAIAGVLWYHAGHNGDRTTAIARDAALLQARLDIEAVTTLDYQHASQTLSSWLSVSTGDLHDQFAQKQSATVTLLEKAQVSTTSTVLDAALIAIDDAKGTATVIASVNVVKHPVKGTAATERNRFRGSMKRVKGEWKLSDLTPVSVQLT